jgi:hypothetical protein
MTDEFIGIFNHFYELTNFGLRFWWSAFGPIPFVSIIVLLTIVLNLGHKNDRRPFQDEQGTFSAKEELQSHGKSR